MLKDYQKADMSQTSPLIPVGGYIYICTFNP
jgi:hypothetical protein